MKVNRESEKILIICYIAIGAFLLLIMRLWQLQILQGSEYRKLSEANRLRVITTPAPRGIIFDRSGIPLVRNSPYYYASLIPDEFDKGKVYLLSNVLNIPAEEILQEINTKGLSPFVPVRLKQGLSFKEVAYIESRRSDFPGLIIEVEVSREYLYGDVGSHLIGYLGKLNPSQSKDPALKDVPPEAFIGQWGAEMLFDKSLRGTLGKRVIEIDALGREIRLLQEKTPIKGKDIILSVDINLQKEAEMAFGEKAGALVAIKPVTGEVLGMLSKPSFDPNLFARGISYEEWSALTHDKKNPMINRALQSQYPPGSTFKIITAIAALEEGVITPATKVDCRGGITYGRWHFGCWRKHGHGVISMHRAIVESCDVYFYEAGKRLGIDKIYDYALSLGLGRKTGIELGRERQGLIPNTKWKLENKKLPWFLGETFNTAIGQGYVAATPLQLAVMTSAIANGGNLYKPTLIKDAPPIILGKAKVRPETLEIIKKGLSGVVNESSGTGWTAKSQIISIAGKTGTAQVVAIKRDSQSLSEKFRDHAWFVAFAPVENPEIALAVFVEHGGHGGGAAAPIAKRAIEGYMNSKNKE
ncbi:MAG: penicillin-binding protein 2 [Thermodesulfovibrio sp. RBG_19FT_COMBO_42_12]|nr:MAG: penicillin-binding protein 2 [Thermodesulfovibrio sp. RBG_19FT_COMBO_42_12]